MLKFQDQFSGNDYLFELIQKQTPEQINMLNKSPASSYIRVLFLYSRTRLVEGGHTNKLFSHMNFKLFRVNMCFFFLLPTFTSGTQQELACLRGVCTAGNTLWGCLGNACSRDNTFPNVAVKPQTCSSIRCFVEKCRATVQWKNGYRQPNMSNHMGWFYVKLRKWHLNTFLCPNSWNPFRERDKITKKLYTQHAGVFSQMLNTHSDSFQNGLCMSE